MAGTEQHMTGEALSNRVGISTTFWANPECGRAEGSAGRGDRLRGKDGASLYQ